MATFMKLDIDKPDPVIVKNIWRAINAEEFNSPHDMEYVPTVLFSSNTEIQYVRPAPITPRVAWIQVKSPGVPINLPHNGWLGKTYIQMPDDFGMRRDGSVKAYMIRKGIKDV